MAWQSDEYIGTGGRQLEFTFYDNPNDTRNAQANRNTVAILISVNRQYSVLVSELHITALASVSQATVTCLNVDNNNSTEISFIVSEGT